MRLRRPTHLKATIYIPDEKYSVYEEARDKLGESISATFLHCLERELEAKKQAVKRIVVEVQSANDPEVAVKKSFEGRWIIGDAEHGEQFLFDEEHERVSGGGDFSIAITKAGQLVVLRSHDGYPTFEVSKNYDEFANLRDHNASAFPESLKQAVADSLNIDRIEKLDI